MRVGRTGRALVVVFAAVVVLFLAALEVNAVIKTPKKIKVVCDDNYPPYIFRQDDHLDGIIVDQWKLWEKKTGMTVELTAMDWGEAQKQMREGKFDVIDTIFFTSERSKIYNFTPPYCSIEVPVFFSREITGIKDVESLRGFAVAVKAGDACIEVLRSKGVNILVEYPNYESIIKDAATGKVKIFCIDEPPALYFLNKYRIRDNFRKTQNIYTGQFHRAVRKGDEALLAKVIEGFKKITPAEYRNIDDNWMGYRLSGLDILRTAAPIALAASVLVVLLLAWNLTLRARVENRTRSLKEALAKVSESEAKFRAVFSSMFQFIGILDGEGRLMEANEAALSSAGVSMEEVRGRYFWDTPWWAHSEEQRQKLIHAVGEVKSGRTVRMEVTHREKTGRLLEIDFSLKPVYDTDGKLLMMLPEGRDVTAMKESLAAMADSEEKFRTLAEQSMLGTLIIKDGKFVYLNKGLERITGYTAEEMMAMPELGLTRIFAADSRGVLADGMRRAAMAETGREEMFVANIIAKDGTEKWVEIHGRNINFMGGKALLSTMVDITSIKTAQQTLQRMVEVLQVSNAELENFAYVASHDLQGPLRSISSYAELIEQRYGTKLDTEAREFFGFIIENARVMKTLIHDLLEYSRLNRTGVLEQVDTAETLQTCRQALNAQIGEKKAVIETGELPIVTAYPSQMLQLFVNLVGNALKFTDKDKAPVIKVGAKREGQEWVFSVADNGIGIEKAYYERIFEIFARLHSSEEYEGTGIGLALCKKIVTKLGGKIWLESEKGKGTTFYFTIPDVKP